MAAGCPVVATHVGGVPDLVADGETGRVVPPGDAGALAGAILDLFDEPERTGRMARLAQERVLERHQAGRLIADVDRLYQDLLLAGRITGPGEPAEGKVAAKA